MQQVTLEELETIVRSHTSDETSYDIVLLTTDGCMACIPAKTAYEQIQIENVNLYIVDLQDLPPLFAIPAVPTIAVFNRGGKIYDAAVSGTTTTENLANIITTILDGSLPGPIVIT